MEEIEKEKSEYVPLPKFYTFTSRKKREYPYRKFGQDMKEMIKDIVNKKSARRTL